MDVVAPDSALLVNDSAMLIVCPVWGTCARFEGQSQGPLLFF